MWDQAYLSFTNVLILRDKSQLDMMSDMASGYDLLHLLYPNLSLLSAIALTIPVSSVNCERDFSAMNRVSPLSSLWPVQTTRFQPDFAPILSLQTNLRIVHDYDRSATRRGLVMWHACDLRCFRLRRSKTPRRNVWHVRIFWGIAWRIHCWHKPRLHGTSDPHRFLCGIDRKERILRYLYK